MRLDKSSDTIQANGRMVCRIWWTVNILNLGLSMYTFSADRSTTGRTAWLSLFGTKKIRDVNTGVVGGTRIRIDWSISDCITSDTATDVGGYRRTTRSGGRRCHFKVKPFLATRLAQEPLGHARYRRLKSPVKA